MSTSFYTQHITTRKKCNFLVRRKIAIRAITGMFFEEKKAILFSLKPPRQPNPTLRGFQTRSAPHGFPFLRVPFIFIYNNNKKIFSYRQRAGTDCRLT